MSPLTSRQWTDAFVVKLRLLNVPGGRIGDAIAEIETYCADAGEPPEEAFGDPEAYAVSLAPTLSQNRPTRTDLIAATVPAITGFVGLMIALPAVRALTAGTTVEIGWGLLTSTLLFVGVCAALVGLLPRLVESRLTLALFCVVGLAAIVATAVLIPGVAFRLPAVVVLVIGVAALVASGIGNSRIKTDTLVDPRTPPSPPRGSLLRHLRNWAFSLATIVLVSVTVWVG